MFGDLEKGDDLTAAVSALRSFEAAYRTNLATHLRRQIETLESGRAEPVDVPEAMRELRPTENNANGTVSLASMVQSISRSEKTLQASAGRGSPSNTCYLDALLGDQR